MEPPKQNLLQDTPSGPEPGISHMPQMLDVASLYKFLNSMNPPTGMRDR